VPWGEFRAAFRGHHLSVGPMRRKLAAFLNLHQGNRSVYEYIQQFNNLAQYRSHHVDTDAKKAEIFRKGLTIQLQDCLILSQNLSYNELASAAIDQEGTMKAYETAEEKMRKRAVSGPSGGSSSGAPLK
jgi:UDP-galactopyranose mutase